MLIEEKFTVSAPIQKVYDFMFNPETMGPCVPGFVSAKVVEPDVYDVVMKISVGIISLKMYAHMKVVEAKPPKFMKAEGDGHDTLRAGKFHQETMVDLSETAEGGTEVKYSMNVRMVGKLATFGEKIMRATAAKMGEQIVVNIKKKLESPAA